MGSSGGTRKFQVTKKFLLGLLPLVVLFIIAEAGLRFFPIYPEGKKTKAGFAIPDKDLIWRLYAFQDGPYKTNELGIRDTPFKSDAEKKVLLLGDSVSWGDGIEDVEKVYPFILEKLLSDKYGKSYEIINSSVPGYSTFQEFKYLQLYGFDYKPNMIVVQFCLNDVVERYSTLFEYGGNNVFLGVDTRLAIQGVYGWLLRNSRIFEATIRSLKGAARNRQAYRVEEMAKDLPSPEIQEAWRQTLSEFESIRNLAAENNIPFLIVVFPYRFQLINPDKYNQPQLHMLKYAKEKKVSIIDLLPLFAEFQQRNPGVEIFFDDNHLTIEGHQLTAEILAQKIRIHEGMLP